MTVSAIRYHGTQSQRNSRTVAVHFFLAENWHAMHSHEGKARERRVLGFGVLDESSFKQQQIVQYVGTYAADADTGLDNRLFSAWFFHVWEPQFCDANTGSVLQSVKCKIIFPLS